MLRPDGTLVLVALPHIEGLGVPYQPIFAKELRVIGSRTYFLKDFPLAIRLLASFQATLENSTSTLTSGNSCRIRMD
jgi:threonine dehydrogenase-like Zn-dependent dehydrogenase